MDSLPAIDAPTLVDALEDAGRRLLGAGAAHPGADVEACPGWDVAQLVAHVGQVHTWMATTIDEGGIERPAHRFVDPPPGDVVAWAGAALDRLVGLLRSRDPQRPVWTWGAEQQVGWYARRAAHETVVHAWDAEAATATPSPIDGDLAADGVDELLHVGMQHSISPKKVFTYPSGSLHLHRTDGAGEWLVHADDGHLVVTHEHAKGDVAVRGAGADLLLFMWGRPHGELQVFGDEDLAVAWTRVAP